MRKMKKRIGALLLSAVVLASQLSTTAYAEEMILTISKNAGGLCEHHTEHSGCGYVEANPGHGCEHEHTLECYTDELICGYADGDAQSESGSGTVHQHSQECYGMNCPHERGAHDGSCGYAAAVEGHPCDYICQECLESGENDDAEGITGGTSGAPGEETVGKEETGIFFVKAFEELDKAVGHQSVPLGAPEEEVMLPAALGASGCTVSGGVEAAVVTATIEGVTWELIGGKDGPVEYEEGRTTPCSYYFRAVLPAGYELSGDAVLPEIEVRYGWDNRVSSDGFGLPGGDGKKQDANEKKVIITGFDELEDEVKYQQVSPGTKEENLTLPEMLKGSGCLAESEEGASPEAKPLSIEGVKWELTEEKNGEFTSYDESAETGSYIFTPVLPDGYEAGDGVEKPEIYVRIGERRNLLTDEYDRNDVQIINRMIVENDLAAQQDAPMSWDFVKWTEDSPKKVARLNLFDRNLNGTLNAMGLSSMTYLACGQNNLVGLKVSGLTNLRGLSCFGNQLMELDVSGLSKLTDLLCSRNHLTTLNLSGTTELISLFCNKNLLAVLDLSDNGKLIELNCEENQLISLNLGGAVKLGQLYCRTNQLSTLDLSHLDNLHSFNCGNNPIQSLCAVNGKQLTVETAAGGTVRFDYRFAANSVTLTAVPDSAARYRFKEWTATGLNLADKTETPVTFSLDRDITMKPVFEISATAPTITEQPRSASLKVGETYIISITATGTAPLTYRWQRNDGEGAGWIDVAGSGNTVTFAPASVREDGCRYRCIVGNAEGRQVSEEAIMTVTDDRVAPPSIVEQPADVMVMEGETAVFEVNAQSSAPLTYQWQRKTDSGANWIDLPGAESSQYTTEAASLSMDGDQYRCVVTNQAGSQTSREALLTVTTVAAAPVITDQPQNAAVTEGETAVFGVKAKGTAPLAYQWQLSTDKGTSWTDVAGANSASYTTGKTGLAMDGDQYRCVVTNRVESLISNAAVLTVKPQDKPGNAGGQSGGNESGSSGAGGGTAVSSPVLQQPKLWAVARTAALKPDENGNATLEGSAVAAALEAVRKDAGQRGRIRNGILVLAPVDLTGGRRALKITITARTLDLLIEQNIMRLDVAADGMIAISFDRRMIEQMDADSAGEDVILSIEPKKGLTGRAAAAIGARPVYDIKLQCRKNGKANSDVSLNGNRIAVKLFYQPAEGETTGSLCGVYVNRSGGVDWLPRSSYHPGQGGVIIEAAHLSVYGVGYQPAPGHDDVLANRTKDDIDFVVSRGLLADVSAGKFSPESGLTADALAGALARLGGIGREAAEEIVSGSDAAAFTPGKVIIREELAAIIQRYADKLGYVLPMVRREVAFSDADRIEESNRRAVRAVQQAGVMTGRGGGWFSPKDSVTRAEAASILRRFVEVVIDRNTAGGWVKKAAGH